MRVLSGIAGLLMLNCYFDFAKFFAGYILGTAVIIVYGAVAQLGERDVRNVEARGSIPLSSNYI